MSKVEFTSYAKEVKAAIAAASEKSLVAAALLVEAQAKMLVPVDTGLLKSSITNKVDLAGTSKSAVVGTPVEYSASVEFGEGRKKAKPYLRPAFRDSKQNIINIFTEDLKGGIGK